MSDVLPKKSKVAQLDTMVTVIDALNFWNDYFSSDTLVDRKMEAFEEDDRHVTDLLTDQVEFSNVIIINKKSLISAEALAKLEGSIRSLNPEAKIICTDYSKIELKEILNTKLFNLEKVSSSSLLLVRLFIFNSDQSLNDDAGCCCSWLAARTSRRARSRIDRIRNLQFPFP